MLVCPVYAELPFADDRASNRAALTSSSARMDIRRGNWGRFSIPFNFSGHPCLTLPSGMTPERTGPRLPVAFQLVANREQEELLCMLGHHYEAAVGRQLTPLVPLCATATVRAEASGRHNSCAAAPSTPRVREFLDTKKLQQATPGTSMSTWWKWLGK